MNARAYLSKTDAAFGNLMEMINSPAEFARVGLGTNVLKGTAVKAEKKVIRPVYKFIKLASGKLAKVRASSTDACFGRLIEGLGGQLFSVADDVAIVGLQHQDKLRKWFGSKRKTQPVAEAETEDDDHDCDDKVCMTKKAFKREHHQLNKVLKRGKKHELERERKKQKKEMHEEVREATAAELGKSLGHHAHTAYSIGKRVAAGGALVAGGAYLHSKWQKRKAAKAANSAEAPSAKEEVKESSPTERAFLREGLKSWMAGHISDFAADVVNKTAAKSAKRAARKTGYGFAHGLASGFAKVAVPVALVGGGIYAHQRHKRYLEDMEVAHAQRLAAKAQIKANVSSESSTETAFANLLEASHGHTMGEMIGHAERLFKHAKSISDAHAIHSAGTEEHRIAHMAMRRAAEHFKRTTETVSAKSADMMMKMKPHEIKRHMDDFHRGLSFQRSSALWRHKGKIALGVGLVGGALAASSAGSAGLTHLYHRLRGPKAETPSQPAPQAPQAPEPAKDYPF